MKQFAKRLTVFMISLQLFLCSAVSFSAVTQQALDEKTDSTAQYLASLPVSQVGSIGGEWRVLGLARAGKLSESDASAYYQNVESYVTQNGSAKLSRNKSTENSRVILALSAIGKDPANVAGYDLTAPLADMSFVTKQGVNGAIWALLALDSCQYPAATREKLIESILNSRCADGGWAFSGSVSDVDMTSMALQALAPYRFYDGEVQKAIAQALESKAFASFQNVNTENCAQMIVALTALGIDPQTDSRFIKENQTVLDKMMTYSVANGFEHTPGEGYNQMATEQAFYALTAYRRFLQRKTSLYDMTDVCSKAVYDLDGDGAFSIQDITHLQMFLAEFDITLSAPQRRLADINRSGRLEISDVLQLQRRLAQVEA